ncbi:MAG: methyltransferase domain-containing protein [Pseudomonadales bacterium]|nr:methyltransferase domain-containing protein [Pseudomonadales bacterium]
MSLFSQLIPHQGIALDLACGLGANSLYLANLGLDTHAWDSSSVALKHLTKFANNQGLSIKTSLRDIENNPPEESSFDLIVVTNFLHRPICKSINKALKPGGVLFYQTFLQDKKSTAGPSSAKYLLSQNELLSLFPDLTILIYREVGTYSQRIIKDQGELNGDTALLIGQKPI